MADTGTAMVALEVALIVILVNMDMLLVLLKHGPGNGGSFGIGSNAYNPSNNSNDQGGGGGGWYRGWC